MSKKYTPLNQLPTPQSRNLRRGIESPMLPGYEVSGDHSLADKVLDDRDFLFLGPKNHYTGPESPDRRTFFLRDMSDGVSYYMISFFDEILAGRDFTHFIPGELLPWFYTENQKFQFIHYRVNPSIADIYTPMAMTRQHTMGKDTHSAEMRRFRVHMKLDKDFARHANGQKLYVAQILNMRASLLKTIIIEDVHALLTQKSEEDMRLVYHNIPSVGSMSDYINARLSTMFIFQKDVNPMHKLIHGFGSTFELTPMKPTMAILPKELKTMMSLNGDFKLVYKNTGPDYKKYLTKGPHMYDTITVGSNTIQIRELAAIKTGSADNQVVRPFSRMINVASFFRLTKPTGSYGECTDEPTFLSKHCRRYVINMDTQNGRWAPVSTIDALVNSSCFADNGQLSPYLHRFASDIPYQHDNAGKDTYLGEWAVAYNIATKKQHVIVALGEMEKRAFPTKALEQFSTIGSQRLRLCLTPGEVNDFLAGHKEMESLYDVSEITETTLAFWSAVSHQNDPEGAQQQILPGNVYGGVEAPYFIKARNLDASYATAPDAGELKYLSIRMPNGGFVPIVRVNTAEIKRKFGVILNNPGMKGTLDPNDNVQQLRAARGDLVLYLPYHRAVQFIVNNILDYGGVARLTTALTFSGTSNTVYDDVSLMMAGALTNNNVFVRGLLSSDDYFSGPFSPVGYGTIPGFQTLGSYAKSDYPNNHGFSERLLSVAGLWKIAFDKLCRWSAEHFPASPAFSPKFTPWYFRSGTGSRAHDAITTFGLQVVDRLSYPVYLIKPQLDLANNATMDIGSYLLTAVPDSGTRGNLPDLAIPTTANATGWLPANAPVSMTNALDILSRLVSPWGSSGKNIFTDNAAAKDFVNKFHLLVWKQYKAAKEAELGRPIGAGSANIRQRVNSFALFLREEIINGGFTYRNVSLERKNNRARYPGLNLLENLMRYVRSKGGDLSGADPKIPRMSTAWITAWKRDPPSVGAFEGRSKEIAEEEEWMEAKSDDFSPAFEKGRSGIKHALDVRGYIYNCSRLSVSRSAIRSYAISQASKIENSNAMAAQSLFLSIPFRPMNPVLTTTPLGFPIGGVGFMGLTQVVGARRKNAFKDILLEFMKSRVDHPKGEIHHSTLAQVPVQNKNFKPNPSALRAAPSGAPITREEANIMHRIFNKRPQTDPHPSVTSHTFTSNQIGRYRWVHQNIIDPFAKICGIMWVLSPPTRKLAEKWFESNLPLWCSGGGLRIGTYTTIGTLIAEAGSIGVTAYGHYDFEWKYNPSERQIYAWFYMAMAPVIVQKERYIFVADVYVAAYHGGEGMKPQIYMGSGSGFDAGINKTGRSIYYFTSPWGSMTDMDQVVDIRGSWQYNESAKRYSKDNRVLTKRLWDGFLYFNHLWGFTDKLRHIEASATHVIGKGSRKTALMFEDGQRMWHHGHRDFSGEILNAGPFGPDGSYTGCKPQRVGGLLKKPSRDYIEAY